MAKNIEHTITKRKLILSSNVAIEKKLETIKSIDNANQYMSDLEKIIFSVLYEKKRVVMTHVIQKRIGKVFILKEDSFAMPPLASCKSKKGARQIIEIRNNLDIKERFI
tara:strand:- start:2591 stop:2917 length:327 start_codon:yes stop_codon:yes gene_type:complete